MEDSGIEQRILQRFFTEMESNERIPREVIERLRGLHQQAQINSLERILDVLREGVRPHAENPEA